MRLPIAFLQGLLLVTIGCSEPDGATMTSASGGAVNPADGGKSGTGGSSSSSPGSGGASAGTAGGNTSTGSNPSGGKTNSGGSTTGTNSDQSGGKVSSGGNATGAVGQGGDKTSVGGSATSSTTGPLGGKTSTGGSSSKSSAGSTSVSVGGASAAGASAKTGGATTTGGATANGGASTTGGASSGGTSNTLATAGSSGNSTQTICKFASGLNVAWVNFAADVPNPNITTFDKIFKDTYDNGGRIVRWWFHVNGTSTPGYNADGTVKKLQQSHVDDVKKILAAANAAKIGVVISLWSFDMAQDNASTAAPKNQALLTTDSLRQSYIDNYLTDLVKGLKGTAGLYAYEIFNEPEGMETTGWATQFKLDKKYIQMAVNWWAAAIHAADPTALVTSSAQTMDSCSGVSGKRNDYSDSALTSVGGKATGTLDFYEVHYYQVNGASDNVFANPRSHWNLTDKKLVIGEFAAYSTDTSPVAVNDSFTYLYTNGYDGAWAWSYTEGNSNYAWPSMKTPMSNLRTAQQATIDACP
jgi:hypothetical protein